MSIKNSFRVDKNMSSIVHKKKNCFYFQEDDKEGESHYILHSNRNEDKTELSETIHDINSSLILEAPQVFSKLISYLNGLLWANIAIKKKTKACSHSLG